MRLPVVEVLEERGPLAGNRIKGARGGGAIGQRRQSGIGIIAGIRHMPPAVGPGMALPLQHEGDYLGQDSRLPRLVGGSQVLSLRLNELAQRGACQPDAFLRPPMMAPASLTTRCSAVSPALILNTLWPMTDLTSAGTTSSRIIQRRRCRIRCR